MLPHVVVTSHKASSRALFIFSVYGSGSGRQQSREGEIDEQARAEPRIFAIKIDEQARAEPRVFTIKIDEPVRIKPRDIIAALGSSQQV